MLLARVDEEFGEMPRDFNDFEVAARESAGAFMDGTFWGFIRHAGISAEQAGQFWDRMSALVAEFDALPRSGETARILLPGRATAETGADRGDIDRIQPGVQYTIKDGVLQFKLIAPYKPESVNLKVSVLMN